MQEWEAYGGLMGVCVQQWSLKQRLKLLNCHGEWQSLEQRSGSEALGDINQGETVRKTISTPMAFTPASASSLSTSIAVLIANNTLLLEFELGLDLIAQAITQAQEQLH